MTRKINNSYELGQSNAPTDGGDMLKTRADGTLVWEGVADTTFEPWTFPGSNYGFSAGGNYAYSNVIDRWAFSSNTTATDWGDLTITIDSMTGHSSPTDGFTSGGRGPLATINKYSFTSDAGASTHGVLATARRACAGHSTETNGFTSGGSGYTNIIEKFAFSSNTTADDHGDLSTGTYSA